MKSFRKYLKEQAEIEEINEAEYNKEWWDSKSDSFQKKYLEKHPNSIYAKHVRTETPFDRDQRIEKEKKAAEKKKRQDDLASGYDEKRDYYGENLADKVNPDRKLSKENKRKYLDAILKDASEYTEVAGFTLANRDDLDLDDISMLDKADKELKAKGVKSSIDRGLAKNPLLPKKIKDEYLKRCLSSKKDREHLWHFYENPGLDKETVNALLADKTLTKGFLGVLAANPSLAKHRPDVLKKMADTFPNEVIENPGTPEPLLKTLAAKYKNSPGKLAGIANNPNASKEFLKDIYNMHPDRDSWYTDGYWAEVQDAVLDNLKKKRNK